MTEMGEKRKRDRTRNEEEAGGVMEIRGRKTKHKGKHKPKGNQFFIKQLTFPSYNLCFIELERRAVAGGVAPS